jgi:5'-nucleotidase
MHYARVIAERILKDGMPAGTCLNVNIPLAPLEMIEGVKVCRQCIAYWDEDFDERTDPYGRKYYWLTGKFMTEDHGEDTDEWALKNNFVSVVPVQSDFTNHELRKQLTF